jgi:hypothetical protein
MKARFLTNRLAFEHLLDQIYPATRPIQLIAQQLIRRAGCGTKSTMYTLAQDFLCFLAGAGISYEVGESGIHQNSA